VAAPAVRVRFDPVDGDVNPAAVFEDILADWCFRVGGAETDDFPLQDDVEV
jgi:rubredoxin